MKVFMCFNLVLMLISGCATAKMVDVTWYNLETGKPAPAELVDSAKRVCEFDKTMKESRYRLSSSMPSSRVRNFSGGTGQRGFFDKSGKTLREELYECLEGQGIGSNPEIIRK